MLKEPAVLLGHLVVALGSDKFPRETLWQDQAPGGHQRWGRGMWVTMTWVTR